MRCPHCAKQLTYRERRANRRCRHCRRAFAFEPRADPLKLNDRRFLAAVQRLRGEAGLFYTPAQLAFCLTRKAPAGAGRGTVGGAWGWAIGAIILTIILAALLENPIVLLGLVVGGLLVWRAYGQQPRPLTGAEFQRLVLDRWHAAYGAPPAGLIAAPARAGSALASAPPGPPRAVLACSEPLVLACLRANQVPTRLTIATVPTAPPFTPAEQATLDALRAQPRLPLLLLQAEGPDEGQRAERARRRLGLAPEQRVRPLVVRPRPAATPPATVTPPADEATLGSAERAWREQGLLSPLLALAPAPLLRLVERAVAQATQPDPNAAARRQARAVGFMTWPTPP